ncbi:MAG TPA: Gfo/Idh/MocA family oxidoreductase [Dehalococcoidia bacterium]|nr:Gfo/Idh/MocA family oxidoreductase [Dehalococcoidia bacterium]
MPQTVRVGLVGAGNFTISRILPGFAAVAGCEVVAVANRRLETAEKVAAQFSIPKASGDWRAVVENPDVDAVFIGTPPYAHKEVALAALQAGKHVLCETRIATSAADALDMHNAAEAAKARGVRSALVPPAPWYRGRRFVEHLVKSGYLGRLTQVQAFNMNGSMADPTTPLSVGRNELDLYGPYNAAQLGLTYDVMAPWTGHATRVVAHRATFTPERPLTPGGPMTKAPYPEEVTAIAETEGGAVMLNMLNWASHFSESRIELYGDAGTLVYKLRGDSILAARAGDAALKELPIPPEHEGAWLAEDEFVRLIRGEIAEPGFSFWDGVKNMRYLEAVYKSGSEGRAVEVG